MTFWTSPSRPAFALAALALLAACSQQPQGVRFLNGGAKPEPQPIRALQPAEIQTALVGKTFQYTRPDGNGFIKYNADGTFDYQDDARGTGKGRWSAATGQFCESFGKAPEDCGEFKSTGDAYFAAQSRLVEMKN
ncbi:MAG: hypothetical protein HY245_09025 [Rhizobiales bacterium]|nr:hypothetical protein [Hyphomicrobiales bacterium]MBI3673545.1 hypothetical protein [Hyphomicrobiales bacterium]